MTDREVMKQALLALEGWDNYGKWAWPDTALEQSKRNTTESLASLRAALEQPERQWSSLTDDEIKEIVGPWGEAQINGYTRWLFDKIDEALRRKNHV